MMEGQFSIESRFGTLLIEYSDHGRSFRCDLKNLAGKIVHSSHDRISRQKSLLFAHHIEMEHWFESVTEMMKQALPIIAQIPISQEFVMSFCIMGRWRAFDLVRSCPALVFCVATRVKFEAATTCLENEVEELVCKKRLELLSYSKFHSAPWVLKLFKKIPASECSHSLFRSLYNLIEREIREQAKVASVQLESSRNPLLSMIVNREKIKILRHIPRINKLILDMMSKSNFQSVLLNSFYLDICKIECDEVANTRNIVRDLQRIFVSNGEVFTVAQKRGVRSVSDLHRCHQEIIHYLNTGQPLGFYRKFQFPEPPIPDRTWGREDRKYGIRAIRNGVELLSEGRKMNHCIAGYSEKINSSAGELFVYHVEWPRKPPATVLIKKKVNGLFIIQEIRGNNNIEASPFILREVEKWLATWNASLSPGDQSQQ